MSGRAWYANCEESHYRRDRIIHSVSSSIYPASSGGDIFKGLQLLPSTGGAQSPRGGKGTYWNQWFAVQKQDQKSCLWWMTHLVSRFSNHALAFSSSAFNYRMWPETFHAVTKENLPANAMVREPGWAFGYFKMKEGDMQRTGSGQGRNRNFLRRLFTWRAHLKNRSSVIMGGRISNYQRGWWWIKHTGFWYSNRKTEFLRCLCGISLGDRFPAHESAGQHLDYKWFISNSRMGVWLRLAKSGELRLLQGILGKSSDFRR